MRFELERDDSLIIKNVIDPLCFETENGWQLSLQMIDNDYHLQYVNHLLKLSDGKVRLNGVAIKAQDIENENHELKIKIAELTGENEGKSKIINDLQNKLEKEKEKSQDRFMKALDLEKRLENAKGKSAEKSKRINELQYALDKTKAGNEIKLDFFNTIQETKHIELLDKAHKLEEDIDRLNKQVEQMNLENFEVTKENKRLKNENRYLAGICHIDSINELEDIDRLKKQFEQKNNEYLHLLSKTNRLKVEATEHVQIIRELQDENLSLRKVIKDLERRNSEATEHLQIIREMRNELDEKAEQNLKLKRKLTSYQLTARCKPQIKKPFIEKFNKELEHRYGYGLTALSKFNQACFESLCHVIEKELNYDK